MLQQLISYFKNKYNQIFTGLLVSVVLVFFYLRPLNSPWHPFIAGDGLGYYSYLPAIFIHHDSELNFKWFNKTYNQNYVYSSFENPEDNLLVKYKDKRINKYYQGLSFVWFPFFITAHCLAKIFHLQADGFSWPYQYTIGLASLIFLILILVFLRKIIFQIFKNEFVSVLTPALIFYGTHLFQISIFANSMSHIYSLAFACMSIYFFLKLFDDEKKSNYFFLFILFFVIGVCIRPLNGLIVLALPLFIPKTGVFKFSNLKLNTQAILCLVTLALLISYQTASNYIQTGNLFSYTYSNETFHFANSKFIDALWSYHIGLIWYIPIVFFVLIFGLTKRKYFLFSIYFLAVLFLYSSWWYWPIVKRAMIDYYWVAGILLASFYTSLSKKKYQVVLIVISFLFVGCYQLKNYQVQKGILSEFGTYKEVYWKNFFRVKKTQQYLIPTQTIVNSEVHLQNFEKEIEGLNISKKQVYQGLLSVELNAEHNFQTLANFTFPKNFKNGLIKKIRFGVWMYCNEGLEKIHLFIQFFNKENKSILDVPFYLNKDDIFANEWDYKEFGYELENNGTINSNSVERIGISVWNVENKNSIYVDELKAEFLITNQSFETIEQ